MEMQAFYGGHGQKIKEYRFELSTEEKSLRYRKLNVHTIIIYTSTVTCNRVSWSVI